MNLFKVGQTFHFINGLRHKAHIVGIVDDGMIVYRCWSKGKQRWWYEVKHFKYVQNAIDIDSGYQPNRDMAKEVRRVLKARGF